MEPTLPDLRIVPIDKVLLHEHHDSQRSIPLARKIKSMGVLRNPPILTPLGEMADQYIVLDGANRVTATHQLGAPHMIAQIVPKGSPGLELHTWNHVIWDLETSVLFENIHGIKDLTILQLSKSPRSHPSDNPKAIVCLHTPDGETYQIFCQEEGLSCRIDGLNQIVNMYKTLGTLDRTTALNIETIAGLYSQLAGLVIFPGLCMTDIHNIVNNGSLLPSGITRFTISPRALHVNYPLSELLDPQKDLEQKNTTLRDWIRTCINKKGLRYYKEETILFDE